jgi:hypothetical protein
MLNIYHLQKMVSNMLKELISVEFLHKIMFLYYARSDLVGFYNIKCGLMIYNIVSVRPKSG